MDDYLNTFEARGHLYNKAMSLCTAARDNELFALLDQAPIQDGQVVMDVPAGGGYVADGVQSRITRNVDIICVEPSAKFAAAIGGRYRVLNTPVTEVPLPDESVDVILSLAGLHHMENRQSLYREWARLLKPGGYISVADVAVNTPTGTFLNTFVDQNTETGHKGMFMVRDEFRDGLALVGLVTTKEELQDVPWVFANETVLGEFCQSLFGTYQATLEENRQALKAIVGVDIAEDASVSLRWQLQYALATKPIE